MYAARLGWTKDDLQRRNVFGSAITDYYYRAATPSFMLLFATIPPESYEPGRNGRYNCLIMPDQHCLPLILASQSARRRQLLRDAGYEFTVITPEASAECGICTRETPHELVARLAWQKAKNVAQRIDTGLVIGCDTVAECCGQILGKPVDRAQAREMLTIMRGRRHQVLSGLCLWGRPDDKVDVQVAVTKLVMEEFTDDVLERYIDSELWQGKAGAFGFQDGLKWVRIEAGSESNVVGLPMELFEQMLRSF